MEQESPLTLARIADILASVYLHVPDEASASAFRQVAPALAVELGAQDRSLDAAETLEALTQDYNELFFVPVSGRYLAPFESAQRERRLWGPLTHQVAEFYESIGFDGTALNVGEHWKRLNMPDHAGIELACLSALLQAQDAQADATVAQAAHFFIHQHLSRWLPDFGQKVAQNAKTDFYRAMGDFTTALIQNAVRQFS